MKSRCVSVMIMFGLLFLFTATGICQEKITMNDWVEKVGQGSINWTAGYIEAIGIGAPPDRAVGKINARPMALRVAKADALRNLLELAKSVQVDSTTTIKDFTVESDIINTQVNGLVQGAMVVDQQYMSDGTVEVRVRMPLYGNFSQIIMPLAFAKRKEITPPEPPSVPAPAAPASAAPAASVAYTGIVVNARGIQARPAMSPRVFDEDGKEVYGSANVDREYAVQQGMSGYARDLTAAQSNQRVTANPVTIKALKTSGPGKSDLIISNADAQQVRASAENASFMKQCKVIIVLD